MEKQVLDISFTEDVTAIGEWRSTLQEVTDIDPFTGITIEREGVEIFAGRVENPNIGFDRSGSTLSPDGFDYTIILTDYLVPSSSIVDSSTNATLTEILSETPIVLSLESTFSYLTEPTELDTTCEFLDFDFSDACIEFEADEEEDTEVDTDVNTLPSGPEFRCTFWADTGVNRRFYIFYETGALIVYRFSADCGATWSAEAGPGIGPVGLPTAAWSVVWYDSKVYFFKEDAAGNTDFYRGTINDGTGVVTVALIAGNIFANPMRAGPIFDNEGHIWVIEETGGNGDVWESVNDGVAWNNRFTAQEVAKLLLPRAADDGDVWVIEHDVGNGDLELWYWDATAGAPELFDSKIDDIAAVGHVGGAQNADYTIHLAWTDSPALSDLFYAWKTEAGAWSAVQNLTAGRQFQTYAFQLSADRGVSAYLFATGGATGFECRTIKNGVAGAVWVDISSSAPGVGNNYVQTPQTGLWDGELAVFGITLDDGDDIWFSLLGPTGIRIDRGQTTGWFRTDGQTAGGAFINWGYCVADGIQLTDTLWSVLDNADVVLVSGQKVPFDIDLAGVDPAETTIKFLVDMTDTGTDPYVYYIDYSERIDEFSMELDYEHVYTAMRKWAAISGGEYWVTETDGVYTLHVAKTRGSDKSNVVVLKNGKTGLFPDIEPNIKIVSKNPDWSGYVNEVRLIGAGTPPTRAEGHVINQDGIDEYGVHQTTVRDLDAETEAMAQTRASEELLKRGIIVERIAVQFLDEYDPTEIEVGDTVMMVAEFGDDADTKIDGTVRIVKLSRSWDSRGESVSAEVINSVKAADFYNRLVRIADLERWA